MHNGDAMTANVEGIAEQVKALQEGERNEFFVWLAEYENRRLDAWDSEIARDSLPGERFDPVLMRAREDIAERRTKPLDEVLDNS